MSTPRRHPLRFAVLIGVGAGLALLIGLGVGSGVIESVDVPFAVLIALAIVAIASIPLLIENTGSGPDAR